MIGKNKTKEQENPAQKPQPSQKTTAPAEDPNLVKIAELTNDLQRTRADFENYRKQMDMQKAQAMTFAKQETIRKILPLIDDMDRAISSTPELKPLEKSLEKTLKELRLEKIDSKENTDFNPDLHDAVMMDQGEGTREVIAETLRPGYIYEGEIIRPAMVKVKTV